MRLIVVSGLAGAGKSVVLETLEDLGYHCIDNFPVALLADVSAATLTRQGLDFDRLALGIDTRAGQDQLTELPKRLQALAVAGLDVELIFVHANEQTILRRYAETRRRHPLSGAGRALPDAIAADRQLTAPIAASADVAIDTSETNIHELRDIVRNRVEAGSSGSISILLQSFGYKHGVPSGVDFVFDVRCLTNPHWAPRLRPLTGLDAAVIDHLDADSATQAYLADVADFFDRWLPAFASDDRSYITIAVGCTGGRHRSVYLIEHLAHHLRARGQPVLVRHNELK